MDFTDLTIQGLIETGGLSSSISKTYIEEIKQNTRSKILKEGPSTAFQILVANVQLETPIASTEMQFEVSDITLVDRFIVMANIATPSIGLLFLQHNGAVLDMRQ